MFVFRRMDWCLVWRTVFGCLECYGVRVGSGCPLVVGLNNLVASEVVGTVLAMRAVLYLVV